MTMSFSLVKEYIFEVIIWSSQSESQLSQIYGDICKALPHVPEGNSLKFQPHCLLAGHFQITLSIKQGVWHGIHTT